MLGVLWVFGGMSCYSDQGHELYRTRHRCVTIVGRLLSEGDSGTVQLHASEKQKGWN